MSDSHTQGKIPRWVGTSRRSQTYEGRWRFILLFLSINLLIFILIWLSWRNQKLDREVRILTGTIVAQEKWLIEVETRVVVAEAQVSKCEIDCTDRMSTVAAGQRTKIAQMTATIGSLVTRSPIPGTPTSPPMQTETPSPTLAPTSSPTGTPAPPTPTPTPTSTPTSTPTNEPKPSTPEPQYPPEVLGITPVATVRSDAGPTFPVTITGEHFAKEVTACLGSDVQIHDLTRVSSEKITGSLSPTMPVGVYGLTVTNLNDREHPGTLPPAFTVYSDSLTVLESPYVVTFGRDRGGAQNEPSYQLIFFEVPEVPSDTYHVHIFDADTGGSTREDGDENTGYSTTMTYTLYGSAGAYAPGVRTVPPSPGDITSGTLISRVTVGQNNDLDATWGYAPNSPATPPVFLGPFYPGQGAEMGDWRIFKLVVEGGAGDDWNGYRVALSTKRDTNSVPYAYDARIFAFSWTGFVNRELPSTLHLHPYVTNTMMVTLKSWGCGSANQKLCVQTPFQALTATCSIADGAEVGTFTPKDLDVRDGERGLTWAIDLEGYRAGINIESIVFWAKDRGGIALPIFTRPTTRLPP